MTSRPFTWHDVMSDILCFNSWKQLTLPRAMNLLTLCLLVISRWSLACLSTVVLILSAWRRITAIYLLITWCERWRHHSLLNGTDLSINTPRKCSLANKIITLSSENLTLNIIFKCIYIYALIKCQQFYWRECMHCVCSGKRHLYLKLMLKFIL